MKSTKYLLFSNCFVGEIERKCSEQGESSKMVEGVAKSHVEIILGLSTQFRTFAADRSRSNWRTATKYLISFIPALLVSWTAFSADNDCILSCNETRQAALSACEALPATEQTACIEAALDAYDSCIETCVDMLNPSFIRGDANRDGRIDLSDPIFLLDELFAASLPSACPDASDANDDGNLNIADPIAILNYLFNGSVSIPSPTTVPGHDPTNDDDLGCFGNSMDHPPIDLIIPRDTRKATFSLG